MDILFVTPEMAPFSGPSDAASVCAALPKALRGLDHRVTVLSPLYRGIDPTARNLARRLTKLEFELEGEPHACELYDGRTPGGVDVMFIGHEALFHHADRFAPGGEDEATRARRAGVFGQAVRRLLELRDTPFDVLHAHDWPGAAVVTAIDRAPDIATPQLLTVHDIEHQGTFGSEHAEAAGFGEGAPPDDAMHGGRLNLLASGLRRADRVTVVSPTHARELSEGQDDHGLGPVLDEIGSRLEGIPNGVDVAVWNPATDPHLVARFDPMDLPGKARCKSDLQRQYELPVRADVPLLGVVGSSESSDGLDLLAKCLPQVLRNDVQLVVALTDPEPGELAERFEELSERWPDRLQVRTGAGEPQFHRAVAGSDVLVVPSRRAPAGFWAMYAHRYGTLPLVRRTGGLADAVVDCDPSLTTGTGFVFDEPEPEEVLATVRRAIAGWTEGEAFTALRRKVMRLDHSWERSGRLYERLYRELA